MRPRNIIAVFQGDAAAEAVGAEVDKRFKVLKKHEIRNLGSFFAIMQQKGCSMAHFDGFFVSYSIAQIGKEFDLLRFGKDFILNIEIKSELKIAQKEKKKFKQMRENHYYLQFLNKPTFIFTYVENDGFYQYSENDAVIRVSSETVAQYIDLSTVSREIILSDYYFSALAHSTEPPPSACGRRRRFL